MTELKTTLWRQNSKIATQETETVKFVLSIAALKDKDHPKKRKIQPLFTHLHASEKSCQVS